MKNVFCLVICLTSVFVSRNVYAQETTAKLELMAFYTSYISECIKDPTPQNLKKMESLRNEYSTERLLKQLKDDELDYDPYLNAQDCSKSWLKTLEVKQDLADPNQWLISMGEVGSKLRSLIRLTVVKQGDRYKIDTISGL